MRQQFRIEYACLLLKDPRATISDVAFECGYSDLSTFYRSFRRISGHPPGAWREQQGRG